MSCAHIIAVFDALAAGKVPGGAAAALVLLKIANRADKNGVCWPSLDRLADDTGLGRRTVERAVSMLIKAGLIRKEKRRDSDGKSMSNIYHLLVAAERHAERQNDARTSKKESIIKNPSKRESARKRARDSLRRGMAETPEGITFELGNERDELILFAIRQHSPTEVERAVAAARSRDPLGRAFPSAVWRELRRRRASEDLPVPAWARVVGEHLAPAPPEACETVCEGFQALDYEGVMV